MLNFIILMVGILLIAIGFMLLVKDRKGIVPLSILGGVLIVFAASFTLMPTGYCGVRTTFGQISEKTVSQGFNFKVPIVQQIKKVNCKQQDVSIDEKIWGETKEKTPVYASKVVVSYQVAKDSAAWMFSNVDDTENLISASLVSSAVKSSMVELSANEVTNRAKIEPIVKENLIKSINEKFGNNRVIVKKVIVNQMDFEDDYNKAISQKSIAQQTQAKQKIENETAIAKAEADKKVEVTKAEAKAETTKIAAQAEAEANKKLKESLNSDILKSKFYEKWDGKLPSAMGSDTVISNITK